MAQPKFASQFPDVRKVFEYALKAGGARYKLESVNAAIQWRQRAYTYRSKLRKELESASLPGQIVSTPFDPFIIRLEDSTCVISMVEATGELSALSGAPVVFTEAKDNFEAEMLKFKESLK